MFRATIMPIFRTIRPCNIACGMLYPIRCGLVTWCRGTYLVGSSTPDHQPTTYWVQRTTSCFARSNAPEDGHNCCPKHVELIWIC